ncbi:nitroreductase family protein [Stutzerimonas zhaodongensis]|jgi:nitroreductase|uniref:Nitroreductase family protein n=1 Tax=Stutzerimonas zhaodongensis TaxID=1176257 RepID=A0A365PW71_9GAMM|nr:nitroreductase family protein [Stutzerimonas zhaodongensis]QWV18111.1 nitroreductase family protein [Stutzerimonas zhaodongensis]RBA59834.1 nitroreductase-like protein [Stutzerimonas zhaodongensis]
MSLMSLARALPDPVKNAIKATRDNTGLALVRLFSSSGFLSSAYYCLISREFDREHRAVLLGRLHFAQRMRGKGENDAFLRRNVHRLEKGLIMRPRRSTFAEDYIGPTVRCYADATRAGVINGQQRWANDVLTDYFSAVGSTPRIDSAKRAFTSTENPNETNRCVPYPHSQLPDCPVSYDELMVLFRRRRSVRWYQDKPVSNELIEQAVSAAALAPSACNRQPFRFYVSNGKEKAAEVAKCAGGTAGFHDNLPCVIAVVGDLGCYPEARDRHVVYIDGSLAAMQLMLALESLGLSSCSINWPDVEERERQLAKILGLAYQERTVMLLAVGYADPTGGIPYSDKKTADDLIVFN